MFTSRSSGIARTSRGLLHSLRPSRALSLRSYTIPAGNRLSTTPKAPPRFPNHARSFSSTPRALATEDPNARPPWIDVLESVSNGPWLHTTIPDERLRLAIAHGLMYQLLLYLSRPIDGVNMGDTSKNEGREGVEGEEEGQISDAHAQYLSTFAVARVPPTSEIGRARIATAKLVSGVLHQLNSISPTSPLRTEHPEIFAAAERLTQLADKELKDGGKEDAVRDEGEWKDFWGHAQPVVVELAQVLSERGFVLQQEGEGGVGA